MIELAGYRYAVGPRAVRLVTALLWVSGLAYTLFTAFWALALTKVISSRSAEAVAASFLFTYVTALVIAAGFVVLLIDADKQSVGTPAAPIPAGSRMARWLRLVWNPDDETRAALRSPLTRLTLAVFVGAVLSVLILPAWGAPKALWGLAAAAETGLMGWHWYRLRRLRNRVHHEARIRVGDRIDLYRDFDWERFDTSDEALFRDRFRNRRWKAPSAIIYRAEAAVYASRARVRQRGDWLGASMTALVVVAVALGPTQKMLRQAFAFGTPPPPDPGMGGALLQAIIWMVCIIALTVPAVLQHSSREMGDLAKIYDGRAEALGKETTPTSSNPEQAAPIRVKRYAIPDRTHTAKRTGTMEPTRVGTHGDRRGRGY